jgi:hypothetical protein
MKTIVLAAMALCLGLTSIAQKDTTGKEKIDTIKVGGMIIIKKGDHHPNRGKDGEVVISTHKKRKSSNVSTNWGVVDLGFANVVDNSDYAAAASQGFVGPGVNSDKMSLRNGKSVNVNVWFFMQKINITSHILNLKYGLGLELNNYRFDETSLRFQKNPTKILIDPDLKDVKKNKLAADYITIPIMLNINFTPGREKGFGLSGGVSAGYLYSARQKIKLGNDDKTKLHDDFDLNPWKISYIGELALGPVTLYGSYATENMWKKGLDQIPYNVGIRFSHQ